MLTDAALSAFLFEMYGCAADPTKWPDVLGRLCSLLDVPQAALVHHQRVDGEFIVAPFSHDVDPDAMTQYNAYFGSIDPWTAAYQQRGGFGREIDVTTGDALVPASEFRKTEFFADFGRRMHMVRNVMLVTTGDSATSLTLPSGGGVPDPASSTIDVLRLLAPHVRYLNAAMRQLTLVGQPLCIARGSLRVRRASGDRALRGVLGCFAPFHRAR